MPHTSTLVSRDNVLSPQPVADLSHAATDDRVYGLVSVLYHALQGAQACGQYIDDAKRDGDTELVRFFEQCRDQQTELSRLAKQLLVVRSPAMGA